MDDTCPHFTQFHSSCCFASGNDGWAGEADALHTATESATVSSSDRSELTNMHTWLCGDIGFMRRTTVSLFLRHSAKFLQIKSLINELYEP